MPPTFICRKKVNMRLYVFAKLYVGYAYRHGCVGYFKRVRLAVFFICNLRASAVYERERRVADRQILIYYVRRRFIRARGCVEGKFAKVERISVV